MMFTLTARPPAPALISPPPSAARTRAVKSPCGFLAVLAVLSLLLLPLAAQAAGDVSVGTKGIVLAWDELSPLEGTTTASEIMLRLGTQPTDTVTVALSGSANTNATGANCSGSEVKLCIDSDGVGSTQTNTSLTFTTSNWDTNQTFLVTGLQDTDELDEKITLSLTPSGGGYGSSEAATVAVTIRDDDKNTVVFTGLTDMAIEVSEGTSTSKFSVALSANPSSTVTVAITSSNPAISVSPASLTFTNTNGTSAQEVTITARTDPGHTSKTYYLRVKPSGSNDTRTRGYSIAVKVKATAPSGVVISNNFFGSGFVDMNETGDGSTKTFTVKLGLAPAEGKDVTVAIGLHNQDGKRVATVNKNKLTFTSENYNTAQTVRVTAVADKDAMNDEVAIRVVASQDGPFAGISHEATTTVLDNSSDLRLIVTRNGQPLDRLLSGPATVTAKVRLSAEPRINVTVTPTVSPTGSVTATIADNGLFTPQNWDEEKDLTLTVGNVPAGGVTVTLTAKSDSRYVYKDYDDETSSFGVFSHTLPTATIGDLNDNNVFTITFSERAGHCSKNFANDAAFGRVCEGTVTAYPQARLSHIVDVVVAKVSPGEQNTKVGDYVRLGSTVSSDGKTLTLALTLPPGTLEVNVLVTDYWWGVGSRLNGESAFKRLVPSWTPAAATLKHPHEGDGDYITVSIDPSLAKGAAGNEWTLVPVQSSLGDNFNITVDAANKELRIRFGYDSRHASWLRNDIDSLPGFNVIASKYTFFHYGWRDTSADDLYSSAKFSGGLGPNTPAVNNAPIIANAIADQTVAVGGKAEVSLVNVFRDPDYNTLGHAAWSSDRSVAKVSRVTPTAVIVDGLAAGTATINVRAYDHRNAYVTDTFTITVSAVSRTLGLGAASLPPASSAPSPAATPSAPSSPISTTPSAPDPVGRLENPSVTSFQSGIGLLSGWVCDADQVTLVLNPGTDAAQTLEAAYGTDRADTETVCGDTNNGFGLLFNWNLLGDGTHTVVAQADGEAFGRATVTVTTLGEEFVREATGECTVPDFPETGDTTRLVWQEAQQNFVIASGDRPTGTTQTGTPGVSSLENPSANSYQSGLGLISGWVCNAERVTVRLNGQTHMAAYGTERADTEAVCGDTDNGFGLLFNWNLLGDGEHEVEALADDEVFGRTRVRVTTLGGAEFVRDVAGSCTAKAFPSVSESVTLEWQESQQNFVITEVR